MSGWKKYKLGEIAVDISYGYTESASTKTVGPKFLRITDIQTDHINWETVPYCPIKPGDHIRYQLQIGDIVVARTGNSTGEIATIKDSIDAVFASYLIRFRLNTKVANPFYVDFVLRSSLWKTFVESIKSGSAQPGANAKQFSSFEFLLPDLATQTRIAEILSSLDDKIQLAGRSNQTLEAIVQALFRKYFVDDIDPEQLPEGWRWGKLGELIVLNYGKALKEGNRNGGNFPVFGSGGIVGYHNSYIAQANSIIVGRKGNSGAVTWSHHESYPIDTAFFVSDWSYAVG